MYDLTITLWCEQALKNGEIVILYVKYKQKSIFR